MITWQRYSNRERHYICESFTAVELEEAQPRYRD